MHDEILTFENKVNKLSSFTVILLGLGGALFFRFVLLPSDKTELYPLGVFALLICLFYAMRSINKLNKATNDSVTIGTDSIDFYSDDALVETILFTKIKRITLLCNSCAYRIKSILPPIVYIAVMILLIFKYKIFISILLFFTTSRILFSVATQRRIPLFF